MKLPGLAIVLFFAVPVRAQCTTAWTNPAGGVWSVATNWDNGVPDAEDDACITLAGTYTVTSFGFTVRSLALGAPSGTQTLRWDPPSAPVGIATTFTIGSNGRLEWMRGILESGSVLNQGSIVLNGAAVDTRGMRGAATLLRNEGTVVWGGTGSFRVIDGARIENAALWDIQGGESLTRDGTAGGVFVNEAGAVIRKSSGEPFFATTFAGTGQTPFLVNAGRIEAPGGLLRIAAASTHTDAVLDAGADQGLSFTGPTTFAGTTTGTPAGPVTLLGNIQAAPGGAVWDVGGSGLVWAAGFSVSDGVFLTGGTVTNLRTVVMRGFQGVRGVRGGATVFRNEGVVRWEAGTNHTEFRIIEGARVENAGEWDIGNGELVGDFLTTGTFRNEAGGLFRHTGALYDCQNDPRLTFENLAGATIGAEGMNGRLLQFNGPLRHHDGALLRGRSHFESTQGLSPFDGDVAPGIAAGTTARLQWWGSYAPQVASTLWVEVAGLNPGTTHDQLVVTGTAQLAGTLDVQFVNGYLPTMGDTFALLTAGTVNGDFGAVNAPPWLTVAVRNDSVVATVSGIPTSSGPVPSLPDAELAIAPNPVKGQTSLVLVLPRAGAVRLTVIDLLGREVAFIYHGPLGAGPTEIGFDVSGLPPGTYVVRATGSDLTLSQTMTVLE